MARLLLLNTLTKVDIVFFIALIYSVQTKLIQIDAQAFWRLVKQCGIPNYPKGKKAESDLTDFYDSQAYGNWRFLKLPQQAQIETWDLSVLTKYIAANFSDNASLTIDKLQQKTFLLLCIATMWRPRSDIGTLQARDVHFKFDNDANLTGATLFIRTPKDAQQKHSTLGTLSEKSRCPVFTLFTFMEKTKHLRSELPVEHTVFLTYVNNLNKVRSIQLSTVANIVKQAMQEAGIATQIYGPHLLRSASSTKAVQLGHKIDDVKKHANWSLSADTFERFYFKPPHQERTSHCIMGSIFSSSENSTTSEVEMEATKVELGTTFNHTVAEMETKDVVRPIPWFRRFFNQRK